MCYDEKEEYETKIFVSISRDAYNDFYQNGGGCLNPSKYHFTPETYKEDVILYYEDGTRISENFHHYKDVRRNENVLTFLYGDDDDDWVNDTHNIKQVYPTHRTMAIEVPVNSIIEYCNMPLKKYIYRTVLYYNAETNIRVSLDQEEIEQGVAFFFNVEIEYNDMIDDVITKLNYKLTNRIHSHEAQLVHFVHTEFPKLAKYITYNDIEDLDVYKIASKKVQVWNNFINTDPYLWAYKYDGIKGKLIVNKKMRSAHVWIKLGKSITFHTYNAAKQRYEENDTFTERIFDLFDKLCIQVELTDELFVVVDVLSAKQDNIIYVSEFANTHRILQYFEQEFNKIASHCGSPLYIRFNDDTTLKFIIQKFMAPPLLPITQDISELYDGHLILQNDLLMKYKILTIDIKCTKVNKYNKMCDFKVGLDHIISMEGDFKLHCVYELSWDNKILRERTDRHVCSSENEYQLFLKLSKYKGLFKPLKQQQQQLHPDESPMQ